MSEPTHDELMLRIKRLERANRRWRVTAYFVCSLLAIGLMFVLLEIGANRMLAMHERHQAERAKQEADAARKQIEQSEKRLQEPVKRLKSEVKKADQIPLDLDDRLWPLRRVSQPR